MINNNIPPKQLLFFYKLLHDYYFLPFINKIWSDASLLYISAYSFKIGEAVKFLLFEG